MHTISGDRVTKVLAALGLALLIAIPALAQSFRIDSISVQGTQRISPATIATIAGIERGQTLSAGDLNDAYQRVVASGFFDTVSFEPRGTTLIVTVTERPTISRIAIEGNRRIDDATLASAIQSEERRIYDPNQAEADARAIAAVYANGGRLAATVRPAIIRRSNNRVDLVFEVAEGGVVEVERLSFVGNRAFSDRRLRRVIETKQASFLRQIIQADTYVAERIPFDRQLLTDFYNSRGYADFRVQDVATEVARQRDATFITWNVYEGPRYTVGRVGVASQVGNVDTARYRREVRVRSGQTWNPVAVDRTIQRMERLALRQGLDFVRIEPQIQRNPQSRTIDVTFALVRGPRIFVERIDIEGNVTTLDRVIRRQFNTVEGDPFNPREIRAAAERIRALGYFAEANVDTREGTSPDRIIVDVDVEEQPTGSLSFGASYSVDSGVGLLATFSERNFLGRGQTLSFDLTTGLENQDASITFVEPALLGRDLRFGLDVFYRTTDFDDADFNTRVVGVSPSISFPVTEQARLRLSYSLSDDTISDVADGSSPIIQREEGSRITSALGYTLSYDTRQTGLNPNVGVLLSFGQELAGVGGDSQYVRSTARATIQREFPQSELIFRTALQAGAINSLGGTGTRVTDRYFNGPTKIRGFASRGIGPRDLGAANDDALGGNYEAFARFEIDFPLGLPDEYGITGGVFADFGTVWGLDDTAGAAVVDDEFLLRSSVGFSIFWTTPIGPLALNFAWPLQSEDYDDTRVFNLAIQTSF